MLRVSVADPTGADGLLSVGDAAEQRAASGEERVVRARHAAYLLALAKEARPHLSGPAQALWLGRLDRERDNVRTALAHALALGEGEIALRLVGAMAGFWLQAGFLAEGRRPARAALEAGAPAPVAVRARALLAAGHLAHGPGDNDAADALFGESLALARRGSPRRPGAGGARPW